MICGRKYLFAEVGSVCECGTPCVDHPFALTLGQAETMMNKMTANLRGVIHDMEWRHEEAIKVLDSEIARLVRLNAR